jgi:hypothetical protein
VQLDNIKQVRENLLFDVYDDDFAMMPLPTGCLIDCEDRGILLISH